ncbi:DUF4355 domain-containing protein [Bacillus infantis]|uniref:DUF4355 domain-containing protein n=1 Tax=Bacillus infantis TaxID=324767 RepID=UPI003CEA0584
MEFKDVQQYVLENKESDEVKGLIQGLLGVENVLELLQSNKEVTSWFDSERDKHSGKALETFKQKSLPKLIEEEIAKRNPNSKSPEALEVEKALAEIERWKSKTIRESVKNEALKFATEHKLPSDVIDFFITLEKEDDEEGTKSKEVTMSNLTKFKDTWSSHLQSVVNEKLKSNGFTPKDTGGNGTTYTADQLKTMTADQIAALDDELVNQALTK